MVEITRKQLVECCEAMEDRRLNAGTWKGGKIPECFKEVARKVFGDRALPNMWVSVVESLVNAHAVRDVAEGGLPRSERGTVVAKAEANTKKLTGKARF